MAEKVAAKWDGKERRVGIAERRGVVVTPFVEYPKMVDGVTYATADAEAAGKKAAPKTPADAGKK